MVAGIITQWVILLGIAGGIVGLVYFLYSGPSLRRALAMGFGSMVGAMFGGTILFGTAAAIAGLQTGETGVNTPMPLFLDIHSGFRLLSVMMFFYGVAILLFSVMMMAWTGARNVWPGGGGGPGAGCSISGRLTANNVPIPRTANPRVTEVGSLRRYDCNDQARYEMTNLNPATYQLTAEADGYTTVTRNVNFAWRSWNSLRVWSWNRRVEDFDLVPVEATLQLNPDRTNANVNQEINVRAVVMRGGRPVPGIELEFSVTPNDALINGNRGELSQVTSAAGEVTIRVTSRTAQRGRLQASGIGPNQTVDLDFDDPGTFRLNLDRIRGIPNNLREGVDELNITARATRDMGNQEGVQARILCRGRVVRDWFDLTRQNATTFAEDNIPTTDWEPGPYRVEARGTRQGVARQAQTDFAVLLPIPNI